MRFEGAVGRLIQPRQRQRRAQLHRTRTLFAGDGDGRFQIRAGTASPATAPRATPPHAHPVRGRRRRPLPDQGRHSLASDSTARNSTARAPCSRATATAASRSRPARSRVRAKKGRIIYRYQQDTRDGDPGRRGRSQLNQRPRRTNNSNSPLNASNVLGAVTNSIAAEVGAEIENWLASLATTQIYTEVDAERLVKSYNSAHPRA